MGYVGHSLLSPTVLYIHLHFSELEQGQVFLSFFPHN